jgi:molybdenum-dependent DNA-binding transcriptional regulator ModE
MDVKFKVWLENKGEAGVGGLQQKEKRWRLNLLETQIGGREVGGAKMTGEGKTFLAQFEALSKGLSGTRQKEWEKSYLIRLSSIS